MQSVSKGWFGLRKFQWVLALAVASTFLVPRPAIADVSDAQVMRTQIVDPANAAIRAAMQAKQTVQAVPVGQPERPIDTPGLPTGLSYTLDGSIAYPLGNIGYNAKLPGGVDAALGYGFSRKLRVQAGYYQLQEYPENFDKGIVPLYVQGLSSPINRIDLSQNPVDATVKNTIVTAVVQNLFLIGGKLPLIVSPGYIARRGTIGGHSDETLIESSGFPQVVRLRTVQNKIVAFTLPFLSTSKMFGTVTLAPQWNVSTSGANAVGNHMQLFELAYLEYRANDRTTFFIEPSRLSNYLPNDLYPQHIPTVITGVSHKIGKIAFFQIVASAGQPTNIAPNGITALTCQQLPCAPNQVAPTLRGLKSSQVQLMFGIGTPSVIPL